MQSANESLMTVRVTKICDSATRPPNRDVTHSFPLIFPIFMDRHYWGVKTYGVQAYVWLKSHAHIQIRGFAKRKKFRTHVPLW